MGFETWVADDEFPILHAKLETNPSLPWVTIYNHMDVQPASEPEWTSDPFVFRKEGDRYFGRGATDDVAMDFMKNLATEDLERMANDPEYKAAQTAKRKEKHNDRMANDPAYADKFRQKAKERRARRAAESKKAKAEAEIVAE